MTDHERIVELEARCIALQAVVRQLVQLAGPRAVEAVALAAEASVELGQAFALSDEQLEMVRDNMRSLAGR